MRAMSQGSWAALLTVTMLGASGCNVHVQAGSGSATPGSYSGGSFVSEPAPRPATAPAPTPGRVPATPVVQNPSPQKIAHGGAVSVLHPTPTGGVKIDHIPVSTVVGSFGGPTGALRGLVYYIPTDTMKMPDVSFMTPQAIVYTDTLNVPLRDYEQPIPGSNRFEFYALQYTGTFNVSKPGAYQFELISADGSNLYIDGQQVVNDDNRHLAQKAFGTVNLTQGQHAIRVDFFKAERYVVQLQLYVTPPGGQQELWNANL